MLGVDVLGMDASPEGAAACGAETEEVFACARGGEARFARKLGARAPARHRFARKLGAALFLSLCGRRRAAFRATGQRSVIETTLRRAIASGSA